MTIFASLNLYWLLFISLFVWTQAQENYSSWFWTTLNHWARRFRRGAHLQSQNDWRGRGNEENEEKWDGFQELGRSCQSWKRGASQG